MSITNATSVQALAAKRRIGASVNAYLILKQEDTILLHLRKNTGYCDGMWSLIAGHVEDGESATEGMIREAREEIGIQIEPQLLKVVHVIHRKTNRFNMDTFLNVRPGKAVSLTASPINAKTLHFSL